MISVRRSGSGRPSQGNGRSGNVVRLAETCNGQVFSVRPGAMQFGADAVRRPVDSELLVTMTAFPEMSNMAIEPRSLRSFVATLVTLRSG
jgi:hypothetical protein